MPVQIAFLLKPLRDLLIALIPKIPDLFHAPHPKDEQTQQLAAQFQTDLHYILDLVNHFQEGEHDLLARQMQIMEHLLLVLTPVRTQVDQLTLPPAASASMLSVIAPQYTSTSYDAEPPPDPMAAPAEVTLADVHELLLNASQQIHRDPVAILAPAVSPAHSLELLVRWQMTEHPHFRPFRGCVRTEGWVILLYILEQEAYYIAVTGNDPGTAQVRYLRLMLTSYPQGDAEFQHLLNEQTEALSQFQDLPGTGIYDIPARLNHYTQSRR